MHRPFPHDTPVIIAPSILASDFGRLGEEAQRVEEAGADILHLDVMDGHFVPPITFGAQAAAAIRRYTSLFIDAHLMVDNPEKIIPQFCDAGTDNITFHVEATDNIEANAERIRAAGARVGLTLNPETPLRSVFPHLKLVDMVLIMSVHPGYGGQKFIGESIERILALRKKAEELDTPLDIEVDGGIDKQTAPIVVQAGANVLVAGTAIFGSNDLAKAIRELRGND